MWLDVVSLLCLFISVFLWSLRASKDEQHFGLSLPNVIRIIIVTAIMITIMIIVEIRVHMYTR